MVKEFMRDSQVRVDIARTPAQLHQLQDDWQALFDRSDASPTLGFDWIESLLRHDHAAADFFICVVRRNGHPVAGIPFVTVDAPPLGRMLRVVGQGWAPRVSLPVLPEAAGLPIIELCCDAIRSFTQDWQFCRISKLPAGSPLLALAGQRRILGLHACFEHARLGGSVVFELGRSLKEYLATVSPAHRSLISRRTNGMQRRYQMRIEWVCVGDHPGTELLDRLLDDALHVARRSWQSGLSQGRALCDPDVLPFAREISHRMAARGLLDFSVMYADHRPVSFIWGVARGTWSAPIKLGFDESLKKESPGLVHLTKYIEKMIERGLTAVDYGHEFADYKRRWSKRSDDLYDLYYYPQPLVGRLCRMAHSRLGTTRRPQSTAANGES